MAKSITLRGARPTPQPRAPKTKTAVCLSEDAMKRLGLACVDLRMDQSEIVEWLINSSLSGYSLHHRGERPPIGKIDGRPNLTAPVLPDGSADLEYGVNPPALHAAL